MPTIEKSLQEAVGAHQAGDLLRSETICRGIVRIDPHHADALHLLGLAAFQRNRHSAAVEYISRAIQSNDSFAPYHGNLGVARLRLGNQEQAVQCFQKAIELDPKFADAYFNLGTLHFDAENWDQARECFDHGLEIDGDDVQAWQKLGRIHEKQQRFDHAVECYRHAVRLNSDCRETRDDLTRAEAECRRIADRAEVKETTAGSPDRTTSPASADDCFRQAEEHNAAGRTKAAIESYRDVIRSNPDHAEAYIAIGNALKQLAAVTQEQPESVRPVSVRLPSAARVGTVRQTNITPEDVLNHLEHAIRSTPTITSPFPHVNYRNLFPDEFYRQLLDHLPDTGFYEQLMHCDAILPNGESSRRVFDLEPHAIDTLPAKQKAFWTAYAPVFHSTRTVQAIFSRFGHPAATVQQIRLYRDLTGYKILPHPDISEKQVTTQFYFPRDRERLYLGTCLYEQDANDSKEFRKVKQFEFAPNTGYSFKVSETSWHGVEKTHASEEARDSLMIIYHDPACCQKEY